MTEYQNWHLSEERHIATLTLNRPKAGNNLTPETLYELSEISKTLQRRSDIWVVVVQGRGRYFSTGIDIDMLKERFDQPEQANRSFLLGLQECMDDFEQLEKPTIAKLHGFCIGGGLILALCCDFRIASQRTVFSLPEVKIGIGVIMGTQRVTRVVGVAASKEMILLGKRFSAKTAYGYGLVHEIVPPDKLGARTAALTDSFLKLPPRTVGISKRIINSGHDIPLRESQDLEIDAQMELLDSPDMREALESYIEKREPNFTGK